MYPLILLIYFTQYPILLQRWSDYNTNVPEYEYDYFEHARVQVRVLRKQIYSEYDYDYFRMYSSTITLEYNHDYFH